MHIGRTRENIVYGGKGGQTTDCDDHMFSKGLFFISCELLVGEVILQLEFWLVGWLVGWLLVGYSSLSFSICILFLLCVYSRGG